MALSEELKGNERALYERAMTYNVRVLSSFGIFIRDMCKVMESIFLEQLIKKAQSKRLDATGDDFFPVCGALWFFWNRKMQLPIHRHGRQGA